MESILNILCSFWFEAIIKLFLGFFLAGIIGLERSSWNKPAGFRTHSLVGISAVLIMLCGEYMSTKYSIDPSRIPAQLLSGIGFIGAGTILRDGFNVKGLTTAASLLAVTCVGLSIGAGFYIGGIATTVIVYVILSYSYKFTDRLDHFNKFNMEIKVEKNAKSAMKKIQEILNKFDITINQIKYEDIDNMNFDSEENLPTNIKVVGQCNNNIKKNEIITEISSIEDVSEVLEE